MKAGWTTAAVAVLFLIMVPVSTAFGPDGDGDGFSDEDDSCPNLSGNSTEDRRGCPDYDGDGWSDPDDGWTGEDGADMFWRNPTQHADHDNDGWGDSSAQGATQIDYWPLIQSKHVAVITLGCAPSTIYVNAGQNVTVTCSIGNPTPQHLYLTVGVNASDAIVVDPFNDSIHLFPSESSGDRSDLLITITPSQTVADTLKLTAFGPGNDEIRNITIPIRPLEENPSLGAGLVDNAVGGALGEATDLVEAAEGELKKFDLNQRIVGFSIGVCFLLILSLVARRSRRRHFPGAHTPFKQSRKDRRKKRAAAKSTAKVSASSYPRVEIKQVRSHSASLTSFEPSDSSAIPDSGSGALGWTPSDD